MAWFRVDDGFWCHPKVLQVPATALALWVRAGSWSAAQLTDGRVPRTALGMLGARPKDAAALVAAGLWTTTDDGWLFHGWGDYQPSRADVEQRRAATAERVRKFRQKRAEQAAENDVGTPSDDARNAVTNAAPGPARPDPTQKAYVVTVVGRLAGSDARARDGLPADLVDVWQDYAGDLVDLEREAAAYLRFYADRPARDERSAWLGWLRKARERAESTPRAPGCASCDAGWLPPDPDDRVGRPRPCPTCRSPRLRAV